MNIQNIIGSNKSAHILERSFDYNRGHFKILIFFYSTIYESQTFEILREKSAFKAHGISLDFYPKSIDEPRKYQHRSNYRANQTPSNLPQVGRIRGADTFPLRNQSLALESLKDQLRFLVTKILGGDSKEPNQQNRTKRKSPVECRKTNFHFFLGCDRMATPLGTLGLSLICLFVYVMCYWFLFSYDALFKSFSIYLYILSYMAWSCITLLLLLCFGGHTHVTLSLSGGLAAYLMT